MAIDTVGASEALLKHTFVPDGLKNDMLPLTILAILAATNPEAAAQTPAKAAINEPSSRLVREVRHELVMLPYYGVFDNLVFRVDGTAVTLMGQVTRPTLKSDAENVLKSIEGVSKVTNEIKVLPLSPNDDRIRLAAYRQIYGHTALNRYALQAVPPIHIIVDNGKISLEGIVANEADKNIANLQANAVPGAFSVTNNLKVENSRGESR